MLAAAAVGVVVVGGWWWWLVAVAVAVEVAWVGLVVVVTQHDRTGRETTTQKRDVAHTSRWGKGCAHGVVSWRATGNRERFVASREGGGGVGQVIYPTNHSPTTLNNQCKPELLTTGLSIAAVLRGQRLQQHHLIPTGGVGEEWEWTSTMHNANKH